MSVSGSGTSALMALAKRCRKLGDALPRMTRDMGAQSLSLNKASFAAQRSPDGESWAKGRYTSSPILRKTGKLAGSLRQDTAGLTFGVRAAARYAWYHQHGALLRDAIVGSRGTLGYRTSRLGKGKSGPRQRLKQHGPKRRGRERGFLAARPIVPRGDVPRAWVPLLSQIADRHIRRSLGL